MDALELQKFHTELVQTLFLGTFPTKKTAMMVANHLMTLSGILGVEIFGGLSKEKEGSDIDLLLIVLDEKSKTFFDVFKGVVVQRVGENAKGNSPMDEAVAVSHYHSPQLRMEIAESLLGIDLQQEFGTVVWSRLDVFLFPKNWRKRSHGIDFAHPEENNQFFESLIRDAKPIGVHALRETLPDLYPLEWEDIKLGDPLITVGVRNSGELYIPTHPPFTIADTAYLYGEEWLANIAFVCKGKQTAKFPILLRDYGIEPDVKEKHGNWRTFKWGEHTERYLRDLISRQDMGEYLALVGMKRVQMDWTKNNPWIFPKSSTTKTRPAEEMRDSQGPVDTSYASPSGARKNRISGQRALKERMKLQGVLRRIRENGTEEITPDPVAKS